MIDNQRKKLFSLQGKTAVVTGAGGFFGMNFCRAFLDFKADLILLGRSPATEEKIKVLKEQFPGQKIEYYAVNFYDDNFLRKILKEIVQKSSVEVLVNNAFEFSQETGFNHPSGRMEDISKQQWMRSLESSVYWAFLCSQIIGEKMKEKKAGSIINISSMYSRVSPDPKLYEETEIFNPPSYSAGKAALSALTRYQASFLGKYGIRVNAIAAGAFPNTDPAAYNAPKNSQFLDRLSAKTSLGRYGRVEDLLGGLIFLASDASSYMTGQELVIDGGWTVT